MTEEGILEKGSDRSAYDTLFSLPQGEIPSWAKPRPNDGQDRTNEERSSYSLMASQRAPCHNSISQAEGNLESSNKKHALT